MLGTDSSFRTAAFGRQLTEHAAVLAVEDRASSMPAGPPPSDQAPVQERLENLERVVAALAREVQALRQAVDQLSGSPATSHRNVAVAPPPIGERAPGEHAVPRAPTVRPEPTSSVVSASLPPRVTVRPPPAPPTPPPVADRLRAIGTGRLDLESLIGRYGTLALAALTILLGAGAFLSWAIAHGKIGPGMRVVLGAIGAGAVAAVGWRIRQRGSRRFGSTLLALALALVHVDAWGAGPYLHLIPSTVALGLAAAASIALAGLAWAGDEEALFSVGVGGALAAPFVTSSNESSAVALLVYGYVVLACGLVALRGRSWRVAVGVVTLGCWLYTAAGAAAIPARATWTMRDAPVVFALAVAWTALAAIGGAWAARIAQAALLAVVGVLASQLIDRAPATDLLMLAAAGTATAYVALWVAATADPTREHRPPLLLAAVLPLALGAVAVVAVPDTSTARAIVAVGWALGAVAAAYLQPAARGVHVMVAGIASGAALLLALEGRAVESCVAVSAHAALLALVLRRIRTRWLGVPIALGLTIVTVWTFTLLADRPVYRYTPFLTAPSVAALAMSIAWLVVSWNASRVRFDDGHVGSREARTALRLAGAVVAFLWGDVELGRAYSADIATFLLIAYDAVVGVAAIFLGRARAIPVLRHVGLGLAIFAALKAIVQASSLEIGLRVGSYLLAGLFLLGVAYWYRDRDREAPRDGAADAGDATASPS